MPVKLFKVMYQDDCDFDSYLTIGVSTEEVQRRETIKLEDICTCFMGCTVEEVEEVEGYKIIVG